MSMDIGMKFRLFDAMETDDSDCVQELFRMGFCVNEPDERGNTALMLASERGCAGITAFLLGHGADVNAKSKIGNTALYLALENAHARVVSTLLRAGAEVEMKVRDGTTPLHLACRGDFDSATINLLLESGANMDVSAVDRWDNTPLHWAAWAGACDSVRILLEAGVDIHVRNKNGDSALDLARKLPRDNPAREEVLDLFREHHPELVMEAWCRSNVP